jgi:hypothetical protein
VSQVVIRVGEEGADEERLDEVARLLRRSLAELEDVRVEAVTTGSAPEGARGMDVAAVGTVVATVGDLAVHLGPVLAAIREWLDRSARLPRSVRIELGGDVLELSNASPGQQDEVIGLFVQRHAGSTQP